MYTISVFFFFFFFQAEDGIRDLYVTGVQTCALPIYDFAEEAKRGQTRDVQISLREVKRQELAALDDAFAREMGDFESLDALRAAVTADLGKEAERDADAKVRAELIEQIVQANHVIAPRPLVERVLGMYAQAYEVPEDRWETFAQEFRTAAESQVRRDLVLDHV